MAPKPTNYKWKHGRPAGASKPAEDASSRAQAEPNEDHDFDEESRPRKRGRKVKQISATVEPSVKDQDEGQKQEDAVQPGRRGRPPKNKEQNAPGLAEETEPIAKGRERAGRTGENTTNDKTAKRKGKPGGPPADDKLISSEPRRRSERDRRAWNPDRVLSATDQPSSASQPASSPSDPQSRPAKRKRPTPHPVEEEPPSSTSRRGGRDKPAEVSDKVSGSRPGKEHEAGSTEVAVHLKRRRQSEKAAQKEAAALRGRRQEPATVDEEGEGKRRRGRPSLEAKAIPEEGRTRPGKSKQRPATETEPSTVERAEGAVPPKRRGRPRASNPAETGGPSAAERPDDAAQPKRRGRSKAANATEETALPKRRGRPKTSHVADDDEPIKSGPDARAPRRGKSPAAPEEQDQEPAPAKRKRKEPKPDLPEPQQELEPEQEAEETESDAEGKDETFRHLQESIRHIPRSTTDKWNQLDPPSINAASALLAEAQRPVVLQLQDTNRRREHASAAVGLVTRRVRAKLIKGLPFPAPTVGTSARRTIAGSYEAEFDFERTVDAVQTLETTLNPLLHSVDLLKKEIEREEAGLAREYEHLHKLETNAKSKAREWKERARREHVLAPGVRSKSEGGYELESWGRLELVPAQENDVLGGLFKDLEDHDLLTLSRQIGSHMESMRGNLQQIDGVVPAITKSKSALQQVLLKHLDDEQYDSILLG